MNTAMLLEMVADTLGDRVAIGPRAGGTTYRELLAAARHGAGELQRRDVQRIAYLGLNGPQLPALLFAAGASGVPFAPLNYRHTAAQLRQGLAALAPVTTVV